MSQERSKILQMLEAGQVTVDEATKLLNSLPASLDAVSTPVPPVNATKAGEGFQLGEWIKRLATILVKQQVTEELDRQIDDPTIQSLVVRTTNGSIHYSGGNQSRIAIHARKIVRAPDMSSAEAFARQVQLHSDIQAGVLHLYAEHPKLPPHLSVEVSFTVQGPRALNVTGQSTNGSVTVQEIEGVVQIQSTNGNVQAESITGSVQASSTNGAVHATALTLRAASEFSSQNGAVTVDVVRGQPSIQASTVNGSVRLSLPADYGGHLEARTQNGQIHTDFPIRASRLARNWVVGQIGTGGEARLELRSQNGNVTLAMNQTTSENTPEQARIP